MRRFMLAALCAGWCSSLAWAGAAPKDVSDAIKQANTDLPISEINTTDIAGLYELRVGNNLFYSSKSGTHIIAGGHIFNTTTKQDLTAARLEEINKVDWSSLPLDKAIVSGNPKGKEIAIFTDPDCPYCRKLEEKLEGQKELKIYTFLFPLEKLHPNARAHAQSIWCSEDKHGALTALMLENKELKKGECDAPIDDVQALAESLGIRGTPTIIASDGRKRSGAASVEQLVAWLDKK